MTLKQVLALDMELPGGSTTSSLNANTDFVQGLRAALAKMYADPSVEVTHVQNLSVEVKGGRRRELLVRQTAGLLGQEALGLGQKTSAGQQQQSGRDSEDISTVQIPPRRLQSGNSTALDVKYDLAVVSEAAKSAVEGLGREVATGSLSS